MSVPLTRARGGFFFKKSIGEMEPGAGAETGRPRLGAHDAHLNPPDRTSGGLPPFFYNFLGVRGADIRQRSQFPAWGHNLPAWGHNLPAWGHNKDSLFYCVFAVQYIATFCAFF
jgi:hypothetical protein